MTAATDTAPIPLQISVGKPPAFPRAGEWFVLPLSFSWPPESLAPIRLRNISCERRDAQIDLDLFELDVQIRPGEVYCVDLFVRFPHPGEVELATFAVEVADPRVLVAFPSLRMKVSPSLKKEIAVELEVVCCYEAGIKVQLNWQHLGATAFNDFAAEIGSKEVLVAGKASVRRATFGPGDRDEVALVVKAGVLDVVMTANSEAGRIEDRWSFSVAPPLSTPERPRFHFLAPRRLALDSIKIHQAKGGKPVRISGACFPVNAGDGFSITVRPQAANVRAIHLRDIPGRIVVRKPEGERKGGSWIFPIEINVAPHEYFSRPERLDYTVDSSSGGLAGQVHLHVLPPRYKHWAIAFAFGVALTAQGFFALGRLILLRPDFSVEQIINDFTIARDYPVFLLLTIPTIWLCLRLVDWVAWRVRD